jgi:C4-dicarboxylate-specific signal transduction histidine kinase
MAKMIQMTTESEKVESMMIKQSAQTIENTVNRIAKIIGGLKTFARDSGNEEVSLVKVSFILEETIPFCAEKFKNKDVDLRIHYDHSVEIQCRPVQISQVILNLLNNAYDAIADLEEKWVELKVQKTEHSVLISVTDSGDGISEEVEQKMMLPFFTTKSLGRGTGLGLSISAGIIESHKGKLYYDRSSSKTKFVVELPFDY